MTEGELTFIPDGVEAFLKSSPIVAALEEEAASRCERMNAAYDAWMDGKNRAHAETGFASRAAIGRHTAIGKVYTVNRAAIAFAKAHPEKFN